MKKKFYAYGVLYTAGDTVGLTDKTLSDEMLKKIVVNSPLKVPVVNDLAGLNNPDPVIGNCILMYQPDMDDGTSRLACRVEFNEKHRKEYEELLNGSVDREKLRFGFMLSKVKHNGLSEIVDGIISAVSFNENGLGGKVICYGWGWEEEANPFKAIKNGLEEK
ncbi:MAG: hypothetical protein J6U54_10275 [Clostridiales bacterium]|nr:hypothetical protein [Clostridiales bacterium]